MAAYLPYPVSRAQYVSQFAPVPPPMVPQAYPPPPLQPELQLDDQTLDEPATPDDSEAEEWDSPFPPQPSPGFAAQPPQYVGSNGPPFGSAYSPAVMNSSSGLQTAPQVYYPVPQLQPAGTFRRTQSLPPLSSAAPSVAAQWHPTKAMIEAAWEKAEPIPLADPDRYRRDCMGAVIEKSKYGRLGPGGWDIDHSMPRSLGGTDHPNNLHALQSDTNRYDKRDQYPYHYAQQDTLGETLSEFRARHHYKPSNVDGRSSLVRSGDLRYNSDGSIDRRSSSVRRGETGVNKDGSARASSKSVHNGSLILKGSSASGGHSKGSSGGAKSGGGGGKSGGGGHGGHGGGGSGGGARGGGKSK